MREIRELMNSGMNSNGEILIFDDLLMNQVFAKILNFCYANEITNYKGLKQSTRKTLVYTTYYLENNFMKFLFHKIVPKVDDVGLKGYICYQIHSFNSLPTSQKRNNILTNI